VTCCDFSASGMQDGPLGGSDCIGPIAIPRELTRELRALAAAAAVDDFVPMLVCAAELARRWSHGQHPVSAQVIWEPREAMACGSAAPAGPGVSFRSALWRVNDRAVAPAPGAGQADVTILISPDGDRLYTERMTSAPGEPGAPHWAHSFLQLLGAVAGRPDAPLTSHELAGVAQ
jgi:hypothetical protein